VLLLGLLVSKLEDRLKTFIVGLIVGVAVVPLALFAYFVTGQAPVATAAPPMPFEQMLAHRALNSRIEKEMPKWSSVQANEATYMAGAEIYRENCSVCHGAPSGEPTAIAKGMFPRPPQLFKGHGVTDDEPGETYWKVANGIRLTGMPAYNQSLSETQMWQVSLMLANADKISDAAKAALLAVPPPATPPTPPTKH
jgi:thiosulfate dehydrogenase